LVVKGGGSEGGPGRSETRLDVPAVLLSGNHAEIRRWRKRAAVSRTLHRRPDLLSQAALDEEEREILKQLVSERDDS
jgi:tRNA (guanine37-N1)-methyltransferase